MDRLLDKQTDRRAPRSGGRGGNSKWPPPLLVPLPPPPPPPRANSLAVPRSCSMGKRLRLLGITFGSKGEGERASLGLETATTTSDFRWKVVRLSLSCLSTQLKLNDDFPVSQGHLLPPKKNKVRTFLEMLSTENNARSMILSLSTLLSSS